MRFFEFNDFEYYALIGANTEKKAIEYYKETVADIEEEDGTPDEITKEEAREKFKNACTEENSQTTEEFEKSISGSGPHLILIDGSLI